MLLAQVNEDYLNAVSSRILCDEFSVVKIGLSNLHCYTPTMEIIHFVLVTNGYLIISHFHLDTCFLFLTCKIMKNIR